MRISPFTHTYNKCKGLPSLTYGKLQKSGTPCLKEILRNQSTLLGPQGWIIVIPLIKLPEYISEDSPADPEFRCATHVREHISSILTYPHWLLYNAEFNLGCL